MVNSKAEAKILTDDTQNTTARMMLASSLLGLTLILALSLFSYHHSQTSSSLSDSHNLCGTLGALLARFCIGSWGLGAFLLPIGCALLGGCLFFRPAQQLGTRIAGFVLALFAMSGVLQLLPITNVENSLLQHWDMVHLGLGGRLGFFLAADQGVLTSALGNFGSVIILITMIVGSFFLMRIGFIELWKRITRGIRSYNERRAEAFRPQSRKTPKEPLPAAQAVSQKHSSKEIQQHAQDSSSQRIAITPERPTTIDEVNKAIGAREKDSTTDDGESARELLDRIRKRRAELAHASSGSIPAIQKDVAQMEVKQQKAATAQSLEKKPEAPAEKLPVQELSPIASTISSEAKITEAKQLSINVKELSSSEDTNGKSPSPRKKSRTREDYDLPGETLLELAPAKNDDAAAGETQSTSQMIEEIFASFKVNVKVVAATRGPVITQYELELLDAGMRVNKVANLEQELCLNLGTEGVRIVAPLPNKKTIGVEVPNTIKEVVVMRDLVNETNIDDYTLPLILGRDVLGHAMVGDLAKMPHLLVAGATGMGKSVCLNSIICSILLFKDPDDVKFILVDPKMVELAPYEDIPHLLTPPITDMTKAHAALEWACKVMDDRYMALRLGGVRDIKSFNELGEAELTKRLAKRDKTIEDLSSIDSAHMSYIIIVVDEYADLMMVNKEVEKSIVRLTAKSRACGIHIILTTQRPSADVVTGLIKSNLPSRIAFRVADKNNSRVVLDCGGAENLIGRGDMLYLAPGTSNPLRGQGVWVKDQEIDSIIEHVREQGDPDYDESITNVGAIAMAGGGSGNAGGGYDWVNDRQFHEAVHTMFQHERSGADFLRRKLAIGYNKATTFVETLEDLGFLSQQNGTRPREFLQSWDNWIDLLKENEVSWDEYDSIYMSPFN
ncbi:MAG: DNA translocase FtsK [Planctomycetes bacterium]|nr:DNA translocase FtsK [Planctomycetota bacterium]